MKLKPFLLICLSFACATAAFAQVTIIRAGTLIDGKSNAARHNQVLVKNKLLP